jgi:MFS family permease
VYNNVKNNIKKIYVANFCAGLIFWYATEKLFMQMIGIDSFGVAINAVVFLSIWLIMDVPSGFLADKWSRKYTLMISFLSLGVSSFILGASNSFTVYLVGTAFFALYVVFSSGIFQALMYDTLVSVDLNKQYDKFQGRAYGGFMVGLVLGSLAGGYIGEYIGLRETYFYSLIPVVIGLIALSTIVEPKFHKPTVEAKMFEHIKSSISVITTQPIVLHLLFFLMVSGMLRSAQLEYSGLYYIGLGLSALAMGYVNGAKWLASAIGQILAPVLGPERAFKMLPWFFVAYAGFALIPNVNGLVLFFVSSGLFALLTNQTEATAQARIPSHLRATTLSLTTFATTAIIIPLSLVFGWIAQNFDIFRAYQFHAAIGLSYAVYWLLVSRKIVNSSSVRASEAPPTTIEVIK